VNPDNVYPKTALTRNCQSRSNAPSCNIGRRDRVDSAHTGSSTRSFGRLYKKCFTKAEATKVAHRRASLTGRYIAAQPTYELISPTHRKKLLDSTS